MNALPIDIAFTVFVSDSISTETGKNRRAVHILRKRLRQKKEYYPLTNWARGSYWGIEVVPVRTERRKRTDRSKVRTKIDRRPIFPVRLEQTRLESTLLHGTWAKLVLILPAFENKKYATYDRFQGNGHKLYTFCFAKSRPRKNQSKASDFPQDFLAIL